jgi:YHS domain-containing protein
MTAPRQERNGSSSARVFRPGIAFIGLWASLIAVSFAVQAELSPAARASTTERVVVNRFSGLAIEGFDPVAYFADGVAEVGREQFEASEAGAVWRFRNEGNRASFVAHPEVYGPQFGGYDPTDVARGVAFAGNPRFWLITGERLYLFGLESSRDAFDADPERYLRQANARWPQLEQGLSR